MAEYKIISSDYQELSLEDAHNTSIGILKLAKLFSDKSQIILGKETYHIDSKGFLPIKWEVTQNEKIILTYHKALFGADIIIYSSLEDPKAMYTFKRVGLIKTSYILLSKGKKELLRINRKFKLLTASYEYTITTEKHFNHIEVLFLTLAHCIATQFEG